MQDARKMNPFELIFNKLEKLQATVDIISVNLPRKQEEKPVNPNELLPLKEVAAILKIPVNTARLYISTRNLPASKPGKEFKIKRAELENWIENDFLAGSKLSAQEKEGRTVYMSSFLRNKLDIYNQEMIIFADNEHCRKHSETGASFPGRGDIPI